MRPGKGEDRRMIKAGSCPTSGGVTQCASRWKARSRVIRICRLVEVRLVAAIARGGKCRVVVVHVALGTGDCRVRSRERERRVVVIETGERPRACVMALSAVRWEP